MCIECLCKVNEKQFKNNDFLFKKIKSSLTNADEKEDRHREKERLMMTTMNLKEKIERPLRIEKKII